ncbi:MAG: ABC transporter permease [Cyclobacteriaceae bacterium]|nr:ABC transporter permease [Cyclobacteriaceae bacterium]
MNYLYFEWIKLKSRRWIWALAAISIVGLPVAIKVVMGVSYINNEVAEGQFMEYAAFGFISFSSMYLFIPLWIIVFIGTEFGNGHVNQVVFNASDKDYFISKLVYCLLISLAYCLLGVITMVLVQVTAPFKVMVSLNFYGVFIFQSFFTFLSIALLFMAITFVARSIAVVFVSYFLLSFTEDLAFMFVKKIYDTELFFLPFHITSSLYVKGGERLTANYYNLFQNFDSRVLLLPVFLLAILWLTYRDFTKRELKPLSD